MHVLKFILIAAVLLPCAVPAAGAATAIPPPVQGGLRYTIAVTSFDNKSKYPGNFALADCWGAVLTDSLQRSGHFVVLGEGDMRAAALQEQDFGHSGRAATGDKTPVTGVMTPAQLLVKGEITHFQDGTESSNGGIGFGGLKLGLNGGTAEINAIIYIVDASTGQVVASKSVVGKAKSGGVTLGFSNAKWNGDLGKLKSTNVGKAIEAAVDEAVVFCAAQLSSLHWSGAVLLVNGGQVYINRGEREGVVAGEVFKVGTAQPLRDPGTGELLDTTFTAVGQLRVDAVKEKVAICSILSGDGIVPGMSVSP